MNRPGLCYHNNAGCQRLHDRTALNTPSPIWPCFALPFLSTLVSSPQRSHEIIFAHSALPTAPITSTTVCAAQHPHICLLSFIPCNHIALLFRFVVSLSVHHQSIPRWKQSVAFYAQNSQVEFASAVRRLTVECTDEDGRSSGRTDVVSHYCGWAAEGELTVPGRLSLRLRS